MRYLLTFVVSLALFSSSGCSVYMAANQPGKKNIDLFKVGTPRSLLLAEFGLPTASEVRKDGKKYEIFAFTQGYSTGAKAGRAIFHGAADILTIGYGRRSGRPLKQHLMGQKWPTRFATTMRIKLMRLSY